LAGLFLEYVHQSTKPDFGYDVILSRWRGHDVITREASSSPPHVTSSARCIRCSRPTWSI